jgi:hypothetical protein
MFSKHTFGTRNYGTGLAKVGGQPRKELKGSGAPQMKARKKSKKKKGKIRIPLNKEGRENVRRARRALMKKLRGKKTPKLSKARFGPNPFAGLQSAGMPGNEESDPGPIR